MAKNLSRIKTVYSQAQVVQGIAFGIQVVVCRWDDKMDLMVVPLDDFDMILGNDFFIAAKMAILPHLFGLLISNEKPCFVVGHSIRTDALSWKDVMETIAVISNVEADFIDGSWDAAQTDHGNHKLLQQV